MISRRRFVLWLKLLAFTYAAKASATGTLIAQGKGLNAAGLPELPLPIPGRVNEIGGIESLTIDGRRYYFGFSFSGDLVLSPLIDDPDAMAAFANKYMRQRDGRHDVAYWREFAEWSVKESELAYNDDSRTFYTAAMRSIAADLRASRTSSTPTPGLVIGYHMRYLLSAASGADCFDEPDVVLALKRLALSDNWEAIDASIDVLAQRAPLPSKARYSDAALVVERHLYRTVTESPSNWRELFSPLIAP